MWYQIKGIFNYNLNIEFIFFISKFVDAKAENVGETFDKFAKILVGIKLKIILTKI